MIAVLLLIAVVVGSVVLACFQWWLAPLLLAVLAIPFGDRILIANPFPLQVIDVVIVLVVTVVVMRRLLRGTTPLRLPWVATPLLLLLAIAAVSTAFSIAPVLSFKQTLQLAFGIMLTLAVCSTAVTHRHRLIVLSTFAAVGGLVCILSLRGASQIQLVDGASVVANRATGIFAQPNELGQFSAIVFSVGLGLAGIRAHPWARRSGWLAIVGGLLGTAVALSRGSMIGIAFALVAFVVLVPRWRARLVTAAVLGVVVLVVAASAEIGPQPAQNAGKRLTTIVTGNDNPYDGRPAIYREAVREIGGEPLLGYGPGAFPLASSRGDTPGITLETRDIGGELQVVGADHGHNVLLTVGAETGLFGLAAVLAFTATLGFAFIRRRRQLRHDQLQHDQLQHDESAHDQLMVAAAVGAALAAVAGQGLVDFTLRNPIVFNTIWLITGLAISATAVTQRSEPRAPASDRRAGSDERDHAAAVATPTMQPTTNG